MFPRIRHAFQSNIIAMIISQILVTGTGLAVQVLLARWLGPESYGLYGYITSSMAIIGFVSHLNMQMLIARDVARQPTRAGTYLVDGIVTSAILSLLSGVLLTAYMGCRDGRVELVEATAMAVVGTAFLSISTIPVAVFQGVMKANMRLVPTAVSRVVILVLTALLLFVGTSLVGVFAAQALGGLVYVLGMIWVWRNQGGALPQWSGLASSYTLVKDSMPYALTGLFAAVYLQVDIQLLKEFRSDDEIGLYRAASVLILQLPMLASMVASVFFPRIASAFHRGLPHYDVISLMNRVMLALGLPITVGGMLLADELMVGLMGAPYRPAGSALRMLLPVVVMANMRLGWSTVLTATDRQQWRTAASGIAATVSVLANLWLIPRFGLMGAAVTAVLAESIHLLVVWLALSHILHRSMWDRAMARAGAATLVMAFAVWITSELGVWVRVGIGVTVFAVFSVGFRVLTMGDLRRLKEI